MTSLRRDQNLLQNAKTLTLTQSLVISDDNLRKIMSLLVSEFKKGLKGDDKAVICSGHWNWFCVCIVFFAVIIVKLALVLGHNY
jgi:hypothetical protein